VPFAQYWGSTFGDGAAAAYARGVSVALGNISLHSNGAWGSYAENLLYFTPVGSAADILALPQAQLFPERALAAFRNSWAVGGGGSFLALKGGDNAWNHGHLDLGSFVLDINSTRVVMDLGADNYGLPGYFGAERWEYYRLNTHGHNTIQFNNVSQPPSATAHIVGFANSSVAGDGWAIVNLTVAYEGSGSGTGSVQTVARGFAVLEGFQQVIVTDEITYTAAAEAAETTGAVLANVTFSAHTTAPAVAISADGQRATLTFSTVVATAVIVPGGTNCADAVFIATPVRLAPPQNPTNGLTRLDVVSQQVLACTRLTVAWGMQPSVDIVVNPLSEWATDGPVQGAW